MNEFRSKFTKQKSVLHTLVKNSFKAIDEGEYDVKDESDYFSHSSINLKKNLIACQHIPIITEIKYASPSKGTLIDREKVNITDIIFIMERAGSCGLSILTQPHLFNGSINHILQHRKKTLLPILMKDIIVSEVQIESAKRVGADAILLIKTVFDKNLAESSLEKLATYAKKIGLQVIIETHFEEEFRDVIKINKNSDKLFDLIGINNRNLDTLEIDLETTKSILENIPKNTNIVISESGIYSRKDIKKLRDSGADAFLIGTSLMENIQTIDTKLRELTSV